MHNNFGESDLCLREDERRIDGVFSVLVPSEHRDPQYLPQPATNLAQAWLRLGIVSIDFHPGAVVDAGGAIAAPNANETQHM